TAIEDLTEAIRLKPDHAEFYRQRGNAYHAAGEAKQAIRDLSQAIRRDPRHADYYNDRGLVHYDQDDYGAAEADFDQAISLDPDNAVYFYKRANTHYAADEMTAAAADYLRMDQLDPLYAQEHRERISRRYLKNTNSGRERVRVHIRYHTQTDDNDWGWFPSEEGEWATYVFEPGESSYLSHDGFRVNANQVRIWAETLDASRAWQTFRTEPLRLVEEDGYHAYMMATLELEVGAAPR
ncbi:MAG: tetratricopeptide repeat protein, partial [Pirellulaceae bacterium]